MFEDACPVSEKVVVFSLGSVNRAGSAQRGQCVHPLGNSDQKSRAAQIVVSTGLGIIILFRFWRERNQPSRHLAFFLFFVLFLFLFFFVLVYSPVQFSTPMPFRRALFFRSA